MVLSCVCNRIKSIFLTILGIFRRAMCFSRKRSNSVDGDEVLTGVNVQHHSGYSPKNAKHADRDWTSWDDSPRTVEEHIERYREKLAQKTSPEAIDEPEPDYFGDMEPTAIKQAKFFIATGSDANREQDFTRLKATVQADIPTSNELEDWDEDNTGAAGWDEISNENTKQLIRDKRKELRTQKHGQRREAAAGTSTTSFLQAERLTSDR